MKLDGLSNQITTPIGPQQQVPIVAPDGNSSAQANGKIEGGPKQNMDSLKSIYSEKDLKKLGIIDCQTCSERTYVDGSDDPGVSFKTPTQIDPSQAASAVMGHEMEHVANEQASAHSEGREIVSQSVSIHTSNCPECGINYVSGGTTKTVSKAKTDYGLSKEMTKGLKIDNKI